MSIKFYTDVHIPFAIVLGLRARNVDVITAQEDGAARLPDPALLDRATALERTLFTQDQDFLTEAARRQRDGEYFFGIIFAEQREAPIGKCISDLEIIAKAAEPDDLINKLVRRVRNMGEEVISYVNDRCRGCCDHG
ncbi:MAG: DUF5615 family PIN-like protein [Blastocatellia bacterium]